MLQGFLDFFSKIGEVIYSVISFAIDLVTDLVKAVELLTQSVITLPAYLAWLPSTVILSILSIIAICIIYKVAGRD